MGAQPKLEMVGRMPSTTMASLAEMALLVPGAGRVKEAGFPAISVMDVAVNEVVF